MTRLDLRRSVTDDGRVLFSEQVPVHVNEDGDVRRVPMTAELRICGGEFVSSGFKLVLSNEKDVFMLYTVVFDSTAYAAVKENQRLLVNFEAFPKKLIEMLRACIEGRLTACGTVDGLEMQLHINERNQFRELTHLVLQLSRAEETVLRRHLADKMSQLRTANSSLQRQVDEQSAERERAQIEARSATEALQAAREQHARDVADIRASSESAIETSAQTWRATRDELEGEVERLKTLAADQESALETLTTEKAALIRELAACEARMKENEALLVKMETLSQQLERKEVQLRALAGDGGDLTPAAVASRIECLQSELAQSRVVIKQLKQHVHELKSKVREKCGRVTEAEIISKSHKESWQAAKEELSRCYRENSQLQKEISSEAQAKSALQARVRELEAWQRSQAELIDYLNSQMLKHETTSAVHAACVSAREDT